MKFLATLLCCLPLLATAAPADREAGCRAAIQAALTELHAHEPRTAREREDRDLLKSRIENRMKALREAGKSDCEIWGEIQRIASRV